MLSISDRCYPVTRVQVQTNSRIGYRDTNRTMQFTQRECVAR